MMRTTLIAALTLALLGGGALAQTDETANQGSAITEETAAPEATPEAADDKGATTEAGDATEADATETATTETDTAKAEAPEASADDATVHEMTLGPDDAPVTVTEYASFTCPHCANFHDTTFKQLKADYIDTGKVKFIYRDVYFDRPGLWAAMVARCEPTRFFGISDMIFDQQRDWLSSGDPVGISNALRKIGKIAGLSDDQLEACLTDQAKAEALYDWFKSNAEADEIDSTPTVIVNGTQHGNLPYDDLKAIIEEELAK